MFVLEKKKFGKYNHWIVKDTQSGSWMSFVPDLGGMVTELVLSAKEESLSCIHGNDTYEEFEAAKMLYRSGKLSPWAGRIDKGKYMWNGKSYDLEKNDPTGTHAIHGLLAFKSFEVRETILEDGEAKVTLFYEYNREQTGYPFHFCLTVEYHLTPSEFICTTFIKNLGEENIPMSDGWHFYFKIGEGIDHLQLKMPGVEEVKLNERLIPSGEFSAYDEFSNFKVLGTKFLDNCFIVKQNGRVVTSLQHPTLNKQLNIWQDSGEGIYRYLVIYTPPDRKSIAIEPMIAAPNAFANGMGLYSLKPGEEITLRNGVEMSELVSS